MVVTSKQRRGGRDVGGRDVGGMTKTDEEYFKGLQEQRRHQSGIYGRSSQSPLLSPSLEISTNSAFTAATGSSALQQHHHKQLRQQQQQSNSAFINYASSSDNSSRNSSSSSYTFDRQNSNLERPPPSSGIGSSFERPPQQQLSVKVSSSLDRPPLMHSSFSRSSEFVNQLSDPMTKPTTITKTRQQVEDGDLNATGRGAPSPGRGAAL